MLVDIYIDNELYAARNYPAMPKKDDLIQLNNSKLYLVETVIWCNTENSGRVVANLFVTKRKNL